MTSDSITIEAGVGSDHASSPGIPADLRHFGKYTLIYRFAVGGMASLYLARFDGPDKFEKLVAIKVIHDHLVEDRDFVNMFIDEARLVSRISHPNVVQIIELGKIGRSHFIAMEYVDGETVVSLLRRTAPPPHLCARIVADAAAGLHAAHELRSGDGKLYNVIHRDVSPQNLLVTYGGAVKVVDFGVARARGNLHSTQDGALKGKLSYLSPEQAAGERLDRRSDVFSLGIVLYEMSVHQRLFRGDTEAKTIDLVRRCEIVRPSECISKYPEQLETIVMRALARAPADRYQTAEELQLDLERYISASQGPVLQSHVGQLMGKVFADRINKKTKILTQFNEETASEIPDANLQTTGSQFVDDFAHQVRRKRRVMLALSAAAIVVAFGLTTVVLSMLNRRSEPDAQRALAAQASAVASHGATPALPQSAARPIELVVRTAPPSAELTIAGQPVTNPYHYRGLPKEDELTVTAHADRYAPKTVIIPLHRGGERVIVLDALTSSTRGAVDSRLKIRPASTPPAKGRPAGHRKGRALKDRDVLVNPYGK